MKQWAITFENSQSHIKETDYYYTLQEFTNAINIIATDKGRSFIKSDYKENYKPRIGMGPIKWIRGGREIR